MKLTYKTNSLEKLCADEKEMRKQRGDITKKLRLRINALETYETLGDVIDNDPLGEWHALRGNRDGQWAGKVSANERLIVVPLDDGKVRVESVLAATEAEVHDITDYHGR